MREASYSGTLSTECRHRKAVTGRGILAPRAGVISWLLMGLLFLSLGGCATSESQSDLKMAGAAPRVLTPEQCLARGQIYQAATAADQSYIIQPSDQLDIDFYLNSEFNDSVTVRPDGKITLRVIGDVQASGSTPTALANELDRDYARELRSPGAIVHVKNMPGRLVYVDGQVGKPGAVALEPGMTALQAIADAGGLTDQAGGHAVLIRRDACGTPTGSKIDLKAAIKNPSSEEDIALAPQDLLTVPRSGIANLDLWVAQYVRNLLPVQTYAPLPL